MADTLPVAPSRYLGHFVAGKLAARHNIDVMLHSGVDGRGITALVSLPPEVLAGGSELPPQAHARV